MTTSCQNQNWRSPKSRLFEYLLFFNFICSFATPERTTWQHWKKEREREREREKEREREREWWPEGRGRCGDSSFCCPSGLVWWSVGFLKPWRLSDILNHFGHSAQNRIIFSFGHWRTSQWFWGDSMFLKPPVSDGVTYDLISSHIIISLKPLVDAKIIQKPGSQEPESGPKS